MGPPPRGGDLAGTRRNIFNPVPLHLKFNQNNAKWLEESSKSIENETLSRNFWNRVVEGSAKATWDRHQAVEKSFKKFCNSENLEAVFPCSNDILQKYASWCDKSRSLKSSSIKTYLYSLSKLQQLKGFGPINFQNIPQLKDFLRGVKMHLGLINWSKNEKPFHTLC